MAHGAPAGSWEFEGGTPLTVGIEEEFFLVDGSGVTVPAIERVLGGTGTHSFNEGTFQAELFETVIEITSEHDTSLSRVASNQRCLRDHLERTCRSHDLGLLGAGVAPLPHPESHPPITDSEAFVDLAGFHSRMRQLEIQHTCGLHVHIGMPTLEGALLAIEALATVAPLLLALGANAPISDGADSGVASVRQMQLRTNALGAAPPPFRDAAEYRRIHDLFQQHNVGPQRFLWDIAPVARLGTVEVRTCDSNVEGDISLALAALMQAVCALALEGEFPWKRAHPEIERNNRLAASLFGVSGRLLDEDVDHPVPIAEQCARLLELATPVARDLGNTTWLALLDPLLEHDSATQQREVLERDGLEALVTSLLVHDAADTDAAQAAAAATTGEAVPDQV